MTTFPIIEKLGGRDAAYGKLQARGFSHSIHALRMWVKRGGIPGDAVVKLMEIAEADGVEVCAKDFVISAVKPKAKPRRKELSEQRPAA